MHSNKSVYNPITHWHSTRCDALTVSTATRARIVSRQKQRRRRWQTTANLPQVENIWIFLINLLRSMCKQRTPASVRLPHLLSADDCLSSFASLCIVAITRLRPHSLRRKVEKTFGTQRSVRLVPRYDMSAALHSSPVGHICLISL